MSGESLHGKSNTRWRSHRAQMDRPSTRRPVPILDDRSARLVSATASGSADPHLRDFNLRYGLCLDQAQGRGARINGTSGSRPQKDLIAFEVSVEGTLRARSRSLTLNPPARDNQSWSVGSFGGVTVHPQGC